MTEPWPRDFVAELHDILIAQLAHHQKLAEILYRELSLSAKMPISTLEGMNQEKAKVLAFTQQIEQKREKWLKEAQKLLGSKETPILKELYPHFPTSLTEEIKKLHQDLKSTLQEIGELSHQLQLSNKARTFAIKESVRQIHLYHSNLNLYSALGTLKEQDSIQFISRRA